MRNIFCIVLLVLLVSGLTNCQKSPTVQANFGLTLNKVLEDSTMGVVLYSMSAPKRSLWYRTIAVVNTETKKKVALTGFPSGSDREDDSTKIFYNAAVLPAGEYRIYNWRMSHGTEELFPKANFSIPFTVHGGEVNYLGDYLGVVKSRNIFTSSSNEGEIFGPYFLVSNRYNQDIEIVQRKFPRLRLDNTLNSMPDFSENNSLHSRIFLKGINMP